MSTLDWSAAGYTSDPIPGDPSVVASCATGFQRTADELASASRALRALEAGDNVGQLVTALVHKAHETSAELELVVQRYADAGGALTTYAPRLAQAQAQARAALHVAADARAQGQAARHAAQRSRQQAMTAQTPAEQDQHLADMYRSTATLDSANANLLAAKAKIEQAIKDRDAAGRQALDGLEMAIGASPNDSTWQQIQHAAADLMKAAKELYESIPGLKAAVEAQLAVLKWVWDHIEDISFVLGILTLVLGEVPVLGEVLAALYAISKVLVIIKMAIPVVQGLVTGLTTGDWKPLLKAGIALGVSVLVGKTLGRAWGALKSAGIGKITGRLENRALAKPLDEITERSIAKRGLVGTGMAEEPAFARGASKSFQPIRDLLADPASQPGSNARVIDALSNTMTRDEMGTAFADAQQIRVYRKALDKVISHEMGPIIDPIHPLKEHITEALQDVAGVGSASSRNADGR